MIHLRFVLLDDFAPIRRVAARGEAQTLLESRPEWRMVVEARRPKQAIDLLALEDAPF